MTFTRTIPSDETLLAIHRDGRNPKVIDALRAVARAAADHRERAIRASALAELERVWRMHPECNAMYVWMDNWLAQLKAPPMPTKPDNSEFCDVCPHAKAFHNPDGSCPCGMNCAEVRKSQSKAVTPEAKPDKSISWDELCALPAGSGKWQTDFGGGRWFVPLGGGVVRIVREDGNEAASTTEWCRSRFTRIDEPEQEKPAPDNAAAIAALERVREHAASRRYGVSLIEFINAELAALRPKEPEPPLLFTEQQVREAWYGNAMNIDRIIAALRAAAKGGE